MKKVFISLIILLSGVVFTAGWGVIENNRDAFKPEKSEIRSAIESAIQWLSDNRSSILQRNNPMLWRMMKDASENTNDERITEIYKDYYNRNVYRQSSVWRPLFTPGYPVQASLENIANLPYYNQHFIYGLSCEKDLLESDLIASQNQAEFCNQPAYFLRPACVTHQMMGILLIRENQCLSEDATTSVIKNLQDKIARQLYWDFRINDVYMQRILMLIQSNATEKVKPVYIHQVLKHQNTDGGWDDFYPLLSLGDNNFGLNGIKPAWNKEKSSFHATSQGLLLLLLIEKEWY